MTIFQRLGHACRLRQLLTPKVLAANRIIERGLVNEAQDWTLS